MSEKYSVVLSVFGKEYPFKGNTLLEIFNQFKPDIVRGKAILRVQKGKLSAELPLFPIRLKRLMKNKTFKLLLEKRLNTMLQ